MADSRGAVVDGLPRQMRYGASAERRSVGLRTAACDGMETERTTMIVYRCEDSLEGIFTAIYNAYEERRNHMDTVISTTGEALLFAEDVEVRTDGEKARKVFRTLRRRFGEEDCEWLCLALTSEEPDKAQAAYRTVVDALGRGAGENHLFDSMADPFVNRAYSLGRNAWREYHHLLGFVRFRELEGGILFSRISPRNHILSFLMPHFEDRLPLENFMIYDERRDLLGLHRAGDSWYLIGGTGDPEEAGRLRASPKEAGYQELFRRFCRKITIEERENADLQRNMLPLRFRKNMTEFQETHSKIQNLKMFSQTEVCETNKRREDCGPAFRQNVKIP